MAATNKQFYATIRKIVKTHGDIKAFDKALAENDTYHLKVKNDPWMPLTIECIGNHHKSGMPQISVCHYGEQNGDLMRDPEMVFEILPHDQGIIANYFRNDYAGCEKEMVLSRFEESGFPCRIIKDSFPTIWGRNLREQGFTEKN